MKLSDLVESPIFIKAFPNYTAEQLEQMVDFFKDATVIERVEVDYELLEKEKQFALRKDDQILGAARTEEVEFFGKKYLKVKMISILPKFQKQGAGSILMHGIKEVSKLPLICDDAISGAGLNLFKSLVANKSVFSMKSLDKKSGNISDFKNGDEKDMKLAIIIENQITGLCRENFLPGIADKIYLRFLT